VLHVDDVLRGVKSNETGDKLALMIPEGSGADMVMLSEFMESDGGKEFADKLNSLVIPFEGQNISVTETCMTLEGLRRHGSVHAAGVVVANRPLIELAPLYKKNKDAEIQTQFDMRDCETAGLLKMDILGLRTVTVIGDAEKLVQKHNPDFTIKGVPLDDQRTFDMLTDGDTSSVFQLEGDGITNACRGMKPDRFEDIIALIALYRPGPMEQLGSYFARKHGEERVVYAHQALKKILERTYGLIVYQEQVMGIVRELGGYTAGEADMFRKAIGKKLVPLIRENIDTFIKRAMALGHDERLLHTIGDQIFYFGRYGFNLGHATGYAFITYWTAYLKANYPREFFVANLNSVIGDTARIGTILRDAEKHGISIRVPNINKSGIGFTLDGDDILFGIGAVKGLGDASVLDIIEHRDSNERNEYSSRRIDKVKPDGTPYKASVKVTNRVKNTPKPYGTDDGFMQYWDFCARLGHINIAIKKSLIAAGAFGVEERPFLLACAEELNVSAKAGRPPVRPKLSARVGDTELLKMEKEVLGFYITSHPLAHYKHELVRYDANIDGTFEDLDNKCAIGGMVLEIRTHQAKNGEMAWVTIETGITDMPDVTIFASNWKEARHITKKDEVLVFYGRKEYDARFGWSFKADRVIRIDRARPDAELLSVGMPDTDFTDLAALQAMNDDNGISNVQIIVESSGRPVLLTTNILLTPTGATITELEKMGWSVSMDPIPDAPLQFGKDRVVRSQSSFGGTALQRKPTWELPIVKRAVATLDSKIISELRRIDVSN
jgi:DNA polymerase-3 subunit alpha